MIQFAHYVKNINNPELQVIYIFKKTHTKIKMQRRNWLQKGTHILQKYLLSSLNTEYKNLPHELFYIAAAPYSGPIALLFNTNIIHQYILPKNFDTSIVMCSCKGEVKKLIPFELKDRLIFFGFVKDESLLMVEASGKFYLVDGFSGHYFCGSYGNVGNQRYVGCDVMGEKVVLMREKILGVSQGYMGQWQPILTIKPHPQNPVFSRVQGSETSIIYLSKFFTIEQYNMVSQKNSIILNHQYHQKYLHENYSNLVAISKNSLHNRLGLIFKQPFTVMIINLNTSEMEQIQPLLPDPPKKPQYRYQSIHRYRKRYDICWMGEFMVFCNGRVFVMFNGIWQHLEIGSIWMKVVPEIDGVRMYGEEYTFIREVTQAYFTIAQSQQVYQGEQSSNLYPLFHEYKNYLNKRMINISKLETERPNIPTLLEQLLETISMFIDPIEQLYALKFFMFLKHYYTSKIDVSQLCNELRLLNNIKFEEMNRVLTIKQFHYLKYENREEFLTILLRYNMHYLADMIFQDVRVKEKIFLHWAKCKIEKYSEGIAFQEISKKYEQTTRKNKNTKVFSDIARYCLQRQKLSLAYRFIQLESHPGRKIMISLIILAAKQDKKIVEKLLTFAEESQNSFLIYRVLKELINSDWIENYLWVNILHHLKNVQRHYVRYLKANHKDQLLKAYYLQNKMVDKLGFMGLENQLKKNNNITVVLDTVSQDYHKLLPNLHSLAKNHQQDPTLHYLRELKMGGELPSFQKIKQYKGNDTFLQYMGQILYQREEKHLAAYAFSLIKNQKVLGILQRKGMFREAIQIAYERRNLDALVQIRERCPEELDQEVNEKIRLVTQR